VDISALKVRIPIKSCILMLMISLLILSLFGGGSGLGYRYLPLWVRGVYINWTFATNLGFKGYNKDSVIKLLGAMDEGHYSDDCWIYILPNSPLDLPSAMEIVFDDHSGLFSHIRIRTSYCYR
jgi:hypothetical protein